MVADLKLLIVKMKRDPFGASAERGGKPLLDAIPAGVCHPLGGPEVGRRRSVHTNLSRQ
jgi:hypothetical protein